MTDNTVI